MFNLNCFQWCRGQGSANDQEFTVQRKPLPFATVILIGFVSLICPVPQAGAQSLVWKFAEGDQFGVSVDQESSVNTVVDRRAIDQTSRMTMEMSWDVESVDDQGTARLRQTIGRIVATLTVPGQEGPKSPRTVNYDSSQEEFRGDAKRMHDSFSKIIDQPVFLTITARGEIKDVEVPKETLASLREMPGSMQGRKMFEPESIREMFMQAGIQLPEDTSSGSWQTTRDFAIGTPQKFVQNLDYTIVDAEASPLRITFAGTLQVSQPADPADRPEGIEFDSLEIVEQDSSGTITFDVEAGNCTSSEAVTMLKTRAAYRDMRVVATINSKVNVLIERK